MSKHFEQLLLQNLSLNNEHYYSDFAQYFLCYYQNMFIL